MPSNPALVTLLGFVSRGQSLEEAELLLVKSVKLAVDAHAKFWDAMKRVPGHSYNRALVAASIGSYGAYLVDGSEYRPALNCLKKKMYKFHPGSDSLKNKQEAIR